MKEPRTIKSYLKLIELIDRIIISDMIGFDKLTDETRDILIELSAEISNKLNELKNKTSCKHLTHYYLQLHFFSLHQDF